MLILNLIQPCLWVNQLHNLWLSGADDGRISPEVTITIASKEFLVFLESFLLVGIFCE